MSSASFGSTPQATLQCLLDGPARVTLYSDVLTLLSRMLRQVWLQTGEGRLSSPEADKNAVQEHEQHR